MGKAKQTRKFAVTRRMMSPNDTRVRKNMDEAKAKKLAKKKKDEEPRQIEQANASLFFRYNEQIGPPYHVLVDTNFINFSIRWVVSNDNSNQPTNQQQFSEILREIDDHSTTRKIIV